MADVWNKDVQKKAINERSIAVSQFKTLWLSNASPYALVTNCLEADLKKKKGPMKINPAIVATGLTTVEAVRDCIKSNTMYRNTAIYGLLCGGMESGKLKRHSKRTPVSIRELLTVAHEANIRMELHYNLAAQGNRHGASKEHGVERKADWHAFCQLVYEDRQANEEPATLERRSDVVFEDNQDIASEDEDDQLDPRFFNEK